MTHSSFLGNCPSFYPEPATEDGLATQPFTSAESAWFWCVQTSEAIHSGARLRSGLASTPRPCEAVDIQNVVLRLVRQKMLGPKHVKALVTYGQRQLRPSHDGHAHYWHQAMQRMTPILQRKGIIQ